MLSLKERFKKVKEEYYQDIMQLRSDGYTYKQIASKLQTSTSAVQHYKKRFQ